MTQDRGKNGKGQPNLFLKRERERQGWSQADLAEKIENDKGTGYIDVKTVGRWERGEAVPSLKLRYQLRVLFGKDDQELGFPHEEIVADMGMPSLDHSSQTEEKSESREAPHLGCTPQSTQSTTAELISSARLQNMGQREQQIQQVDQRKQLVETAPNFWIKKRLFSPYVPFSHYLISAALGALSMLLIISFVLFSFHASISSPTQIKSGGQWISPASEVEVHDLLHFTARAYPLQSGDPAISYVDFTIAWPGGIWITPCRRLPVLSNDDTVQCDVSLRHLGARGGRYALALMSITARGMLHLHQMVCVE